MHNNGFFYNLRVGKNVLNNTQKAHDLDMLFIKIQIFCKANNTINKIKR